MCSDRYRLQQSTDGSRPGWTSSAMRMRGGLARSLVSSADGQHKCARPEVYFPRRDNRNAAHAAHAAVPVPYPLIRQSLDRVSLAHTRSCFQSSHVPCRVAQWLQLSVRKRHAAHCISSDLVSSYTTAKSDALSRYISIIILANLVYTTTLKARVVLDFVVPWSWFINCG
jgi:hypothetical protein